MPRPSKLFVRPFDMEAHPPTGLTNFQKGPRKVSPMGATGEAGPEVEGDALVTVIPHGEAVILPTSAHMSDVPACQR
jgi:hypothetical protein